MKMLRALAEQMPAIPTVKSVKKEQIAGRELSEKIAAGAIPISKDTTIDESQRYWLRTPVIGPMNHLKRMKKLHTQHGVQGVNAHINAVNQYIISTKTAK